MSASAFVHLYQPSFLGGKRTKALLQTGFTAPSHPLLPHLQLCLDEVEQKEVLVGFSGPRRPFKAGQRLHTAYLHFKVVAAARIATL